MLEQRPVVVKPAADVAGVSVHRVGTEAELERAADEVAGRGLEFLVEPFLPGREFTVAVEIELTTPLFDYAAKYRAGAVRELCPAPVEEGFAARLRELAPAAHRALGFGADAYSHTDFRCDASGEPMCIEVNALPGLAATSLLPPAASGAGWSHPKLTQRILDLAGGLSRPGGPWCRGSGRRVPKLRVCRAE
ncbi:hypothetical protein ACIA8O_18965 [Kitasatospora sp. NPDC051853]|uniref:hypothetical protein n=1 Tax=Kitasatospora sp. NPDC051853 TaxID=3364058 RepID=UPI003794877F